MKIVLKQIEELQKEIQQHTNSIDANERQSIKEYFRIGLTYSSNALEGNTLTESETKIVLEEGITIGGKRLVEHLEAIGHSDAYDFMYRCVQAKVVTEEDIKHLHWLFYYRIDEKHAGVYRTIKVYITGSKYPLPIPGQVSSLMQNLIPEIDVMRRKEHPVICAAKAHKQLVFIHPFVDGNGRVARLLMNLMLLQAGYTIAIIPPILRAQYIQSLEKAHDNDADFIRLIAQTVKETQQDYLRLFR